MRDLKTDPPEPTSEQCSAHAVLEHEGQPFVACWYPQMGGYGAHCLVNKYIVGEDSCFEAFIWHDGEFPFTADSGGATGDGRGPYHLHHCSAEQFVEFGQFVRGL